MLVASSDRQFASWQCGRAAEPQVMVWGSGCGARGLGLGVLTNVSLLSVRRPLFPGADYVKQLEYIINYIGTPTEEDLSAIGGNERASKYASSLGNGSTNSLPQVHLLPPFPLFFQIHQFLSLFFSALSRSLFSLFSSFLSVLVLLSSPPHPPPLLSLNTLPPPSTLPQPTPKQSTSSSAPSCSTRTSE